MCLVKKSFLIIVLVTCLSSMLSSQEARQITLTGRVIDAEGQPVHKAKVLLYYNHTRWSMGNRIAEETESGTGGSFTFKNSLKYGDVTQYPYGNDSYIILVCHPDYAFGWKNIIKGQEQTSYEITLTEPKSRTITVTDHDGNPLAGARVWSYNVGNQSDSEPLFRDYLSLPTYVAAIGSVTDDNGRAVIKNLPDTRCSINAELKGYATGLAFSSQNTIRLNKGATVSGTVVNEDNEPVQDALIKFRTEWMWNFFLTKTDSQGKFHLEDISAEGWDMSPWGESANANGIYIITIEHNDYISSETQDQFEPGEIVEDFIIEACRGTLVKCNVVDVNTNLPVDGARIQGSNESGRIDGRTDSNGVLNVRVMSGQTSIYFGSPPEGVYVLRDSNPPESSLRFDAQGREMDVTLKSPAIAGRLVTVTGKVQLPDGKPAADVKISTTCSKHYETLTFSGAGGAYTATNSDGSFELKDVPSGLKLFLYGTTRDYQYVLAEVIDNVEDPTILSSPLVMKPGQAADVLLTDKKGQPCTDIPISIKPVMWGNQLFRADYRNSRTDSQGRLKINGILQGMQYYLIDSRGEDSGALDIYFNQTITLIPLEKEERKIVSFEGIDIEFDIEQEEGKKMLLCFFDIEQRPSRNCITQLNTKAQELKTQGIEIVAIQSSAIDENTLNEWINEQNISFSVGMIESDEEQIRLNWGVKALPWLILTNKEHIVQAEGFAINELDKNIK